MKETFEEVLHQYTPMIHHIINSLHIYKEKEHYVHEGTIALWEATCSFQEEKGSFTSYAYSSIRGKLLNKLKKEVSWEHKHSVCEILPEQTIETNIPILANMEEYTQNLTENQTKWLLEYFCNNKKLEEIANQEGVSIAAVKSWRKEALKKLRKQFSKRE